MCKFFMPKQNAWLLKSSWVADPCYAASHTGRTKDIHQSALKNGGLKSMLESRLFVKIDHCSASWMPTPVLERLHHTSAQKQHRSGMKLVVDFSISANLLDYLPLRHIPHCTVEHPILGPVPKQLPMGVGTTISLWIYDGAINAMRAGLTLSSMRDIRWLIILPPLSPCKSKLSSTTTVATNPGSTVVKSFQLPMKIGNGSMRDGPQSHGKLTSQSTRDRLKCSFRRGWPNSSPWKSLPWETQSLAQVRGIHTIRRWRPRSNWLLARSHMICGFKRLDGLFWNALQVNLLAYDAYWLYYAHAAGSTDTNPWAATFMSDYYKIERTSWTGCWIPYRNLRARQQSSCSGLYG